jgi:GNT-I family
MQLPLKFLDRIKLNDVAVPFRAMDLSFLRSDAYDQQHRASVAAAKQVTLQQLLQLLPTTPVLPLTNTPAVPAAIVAAVAVVPDGSNNITSSSSSSSTTALRVLYGSGTSEENLDALSTALGLIGGPAYGVPRTAYKGVVSFRRAGVMVHLCPADYLPAQ